MTEIARMTTLKPINADRLLIRYVAAVSRTGGTPHSEVGHDEEHGENSGGRTRLGGGDCHAEGGLEQQPRAGTGDRRSQQVEGERWVVESDDNQGHADGYTDETEDEHPDDGQFREQRLGEGGHARTRKPASPQMNGELSCSSL